MEEQKKESVRSYLRAEGLFPPNFAKILSCCPIKSCLRMTAAHKSGTTDSLTSKYFCLSTSTFTRQHPNVGELREVDATDTVFPNRVGRPSFWASYLQMKLSVLSLSMRALTFLLFIFIGVVTGNKSVNDAAITTEFEWRAVEVFEQNIWG